MVEASSPGSVPSLAAISTDGEESLQLMREVPANASSTSYSVTVDDIGVDSWHAILDDEEEEIVTRISRCSSGILSAETNLEMDFETTEAESLHSLSSAKTLKSPSGRTIEEQADQTTPHNKVEFERVDTDEVPVHRACHGALNISPKQLAGVFALFSADRKAKEKENQAQPQQEEKPVKQPQEEEATSTPEPRFVPATCQEHSNPFSVHDRFKSQARSAQPKLTSELYWKPRAKTLQQEVDTLREILADDSRRLLEAKGALEALRSDKMQNLEEMESCRQELASTKDRLVSTQQELASTKQDLDTLKKEREVLLENETEFRETIRILKHEVDMLTRESKPKKSPKKKAATTVELEELLQLRLENQLFAAQIVDYEAELERLEQQVKSPPQNDPHKERAQEEPRAKDSPKSIAIAKMPQKQELPESNVIALERLSEDNVGVFRAPSEGGGQEKSEEPRSAKDLASKLPRVETVASTSKLPYVENVTPSMEEDGVESLLDETASQPSRWRKTRIAIEKVEDPAAGEEEKAMEEEEEGTDRDCMQELASGMPSGIAMPSGMPTEFPQQILGNVLGMFTVGGTDEGSDSADKAEVFVVHEAALPPSPTEDNKVPCLQWKSPDQLPTFVQVDNIVPLENVEDRNPPSSTGSPEDPEMPLTDKTNLQDSEPPRVLAKEQVKQKGSSETTAIEVLQNSDASQSIEVQLGPRNPEKKKDPDEGTSCTDTCKEKCDVWHALSKCPFDSEAQ